MAWVLFTIYFLVYGLGSVQISFVLNLKFFFFNIDRLELSSHYIMYWKLFWQISYRKDSLLKSVPNSCWTSRGSNLRNSKAVRQETTQVTNCATGRHSFVSKLMKSRMDGPIFELHFFFTYGIYDTQTSCMPNFRTTKFFGGE